MLIVAHLSVARKYSLTIIHSQKIASTNINGLNKLFRATGSKHKTIFHPDQSPKIM